MILFWQSLINGLLLGGIYAACSAGFSLAFGVMGVVNLSHGDFVMLGAFITYWLFILVGSRPFSHSALHPCGPFSSRLSFAAAGHQPLDGLSSDHVLPPDLRLSSGPLEYGSEGLERRFPNGPDFLFRPYLSLCRTGHTLFPRHYLYFGHGRDPGALISFFTGQRRDGPSGRRPRTGKWPSSWASGYSGYTPLPLP